MSTSKTGSYKEEALAQARRELQQELLADPSKHGWSVGQAEAISAALVPVEVDEAMGPAKAD
eukprot:1220106-Pyramimonas_sp.AAC.1